MRELKNPRCSDCNKLMDPGYLIDHTHGGVLPAAWVAGARRWRWWSGLSIKKKEKTAVVTFRCPDCGRLASYAIAGDWPPR